MLDVSVSGCRAWKRGGTPERKRLTDAQMLALIRAIHVELKGAYGSPRMVRELRDRGFSASKERVERLMRENGIRARHKRRYKATTALPDKLAEYGMTCSMSRKGNCWDNAPTESWFNSFKNERVHGTRYATRAEATADAFEYIEVFYNRKRRHSTLGYKSPTQFMEDWISTQHGGKLVA